MKWLRDRRRRAILRDTQLDDDAWHATLALPLFTGLNRDEQARLAHWVALFLHDKAINGAAGLVIDQRVQLTIAAQACLLVLNLDPDCYRGWREIIVYPDEFVPHREYTDEHGIVHDSRYPMLGEAWPQGPVILSWADVASAGQLDGVNVVIHEFAHKLDMRNGDANGLPTLHGDMRVRDWAAAFEPAYRDLCQRVDADEDTAIDPYATESPAEFFAVLTELFFEAPHLLSAEYPAVYTQMQAFYKQDPLQRLSAKVFEPQNTPQSL